jgi:hypothetical protein
MDGSIIFACLSEANLCFTLAKALVSADMDGAL